MVDVWYKSEDHSSFHMSRRLIREEGLLCGGSSGTAMVAALEAAKSLKKGQKCVVILPDGVRNYMTKFLSDQWMINRGYMDYSSLDESSHWSVTFRARFVINKDEVEVNVSQCSFYLNQRWSSKTVSALKLNAPLTVLPSCSCQDAVEIMNKENFDQLPVVNDSGYLGIFLTKSIRWAVNFL